MATVRPAANSRRHRSLRPPRAADRTNRGGQVSPWSISVTCCNKPPPRCRRPPSRCPTAPRWSASRPVPSPLSPAKDIDHPSGSQASILYYIIDGSLTVLTGTTKRELISPYINRGEFIGEMGLFVETRGARWWLRTRTSLRTGRDQLRAPVPAVRRPAARVPKILFSARSCPTACCTPAAKVRSPGLHGRDQPCGQDLIDLCSEPIAVAPQGHADPHFAPGRSSRIVGCSRARWWGACSSSLEEEGHDLVSGKNHRGLRHALTR